MCGHHGARKRSDQAAAEERETYTGETISLRGEQTAQPAQRRHGGFPFWTLWLLWPLFGALKAAAPALVAAAVGVAQLTVPLWPLALIGIGVLLLWRR